MLGIHQFPSPNFGERRDGKSPQLVILHYTDMPTAKEALDRMCDPVAEVSAHYLIDEKGCIFQLVAEEKRAWHAGVSNWHGEKDINSLSIGIELANPGHSNGLQAFPKIQISSLITLIKEIQKRHSIPNWGIIGHSDIAPGRKIDPGPLFPWQILAEKDIGLWAVPSENPYLLCQNDIVKRLAKLGYDVSNPQQAIAAFQLHFRPENYDGKMDLETSAILLGLTGG